MSVKLIHLCLMLGLSTLGFGSHRALAQSNEVSGGSPEDFAALIKSESAKWSVVVKTANIKPEQLESNS